MKPIYPLISLLILIAPLSATAQVKRLKTLPGAFYRETFNWGNPADPKGWTAPPWYYLEDPNDTGYNWHWWPNDSMNCSWIAEPPFQSTSKGDGHLCLFAALYNNFRTLPELKSINNSIVFPSIDCSGHNSVILQFETNFMNSGYQGTMNGGWQCKVEVSPDNGIHWNQFDASFGIIGGSRPNDAGPGEAALFRENITEIAAGQSMVKIRINWISYSGLYFWNIDDLELTEALPNDLRLDKFDIQWDDRISTTNETLSYMIPISQVGKGQSFELFKSWVTNMGAHEATNIAFDVTIRHDNVIAFQESKTIESMWPGYKGSLDLAGKYKPEGKGTYSIQYRWKHDQEDDFPEDNERTVIFKVTDSVYNRAGDQPDYTYSYATLNYGRDDWSLYANINHFMGSVFPIYTDCELEGISAYIMGGLADGLIDFGYSVTLADWSTGLLSTQLLMKTDRLFLDSSMFNTWVYLPFTKDGESEFVKAGSMLWAGLEYSNWHPEDIVRRDKGLSMGGTHQVPIHDAPAVGGKPYPTAHEGFQWQLFTTKNLMVRLYLHNTVNSTDPDISRGNSFAMAQNYPNPFVNQTSIVYSLYEGSSVSLEITDLTGQVVLKKEEGLQPVGNHSILIQNPGLVPGIYFYTLYTEVYRETKKMIVVPQY